MNYKLASTISKYYPFIAVGLIILAGIGGVWLYQSSRPSTEDRKREEVIFSYRGEFNHWAIVEENNILWEIGENKEDWPVYFTKIMPDLNAKFTFSASGLDPENSYVSLNSHL